MLLSCLFDHRHASVHVARLEAVCHDLTGLEQGEPFENTTHFKRVRALVDDRSVLVRFNRTSCNSCVINVVASHCRLPWLEKLRENDGGAHGNEIRLMRRFDRAASDHVLNAHPQSGTSIHQRSSIKPTLLVLACMRARACMNAQVRTCICVYACMYGAKFVQSIHNIYTCQPCVA
jgi:hypothetical protein